MGYKDCIQNSSSGIKEMKCVAEEAKDKLGKFGESMIGIVAPTLYAADNSVDKSMEYKKTAADTFTKTFGLKR